MHAREEGELSGAKAGEMKLGEKRDGRGRVCFGFQKRKKTKTGSQKQTLPRNNKPVLTASPNKQ